LLAPLLPGWKGNILCDRATKTPGDLRTLPLFQEPILRCPCGIPLWLVLAFRVPHSSSLHRIGYCAHPSCDHLVGRARLTETFRQGIRAICTNRSTVALHPFLPCLTLWQSTTKLAQCGSPECFMADIGWSYVSTHADTVRVHAPPASR
jgi:hypothetical protein